MHQRIAELHAVGLPPDLDDTARSSMPDGLMKHFRPLLQRCIEAKTPTAETIVSAREYVEHRSSRKGLLQALLASAMIDTWQPIVDGFLEEGIRHDGEFVAFTKDMYRHFVANRSWQPKQRLHAKRAFEGVRGMMHFGVSNVVHNCFWYFDVAPRTFAAQYGRHPNNEELEALYDSVLPLLRTIGSMQDNVHHLLFCRTRNFTAANEGAIKHPFLDSPPFVAEDHGVVDGAIVIADRVWDDVLTWLKELMAEGHWTCDKKHGGCPATPFFAPIHHWCREVAMKALAPNLEKTMELR